MSNEIKNNKQQEIVETLQKYFGISPERILFLNPRDPNDPWIPPSELESIARQIGGFQTINVTHDKYIPETNQVVYQTLVIDSSDRSFVRSGVAKIGETPNGFEIDTDVLASGRSLGAALSAAGFHPYKSGWIASFSEMQETVKPQELSEADRSAHLAEDEATLRGKDLRQIHALAIEKELWVGSDDSRYRRELFNKFGVHTSAVMDRTQRAAVINWLTNLRVEPTYFAGIPNELRQDALIA